MKRRGSQRLSTVTLELKRHLSDVDTLAGLVGVGVDSRVEQLRPCRPHSEERPVSMARGQVCKLRRDVRPPAADLHRPAAGGRAPAAHASHGCAHAWRACVQPWVAVLPQSSALGYAGEGMC